MTVFLCYEETEGSYDGDELVKIVADQKKAEEWKNSIKDAGDVINRYYIEREVEE